MNFLFLMDPLETVIMDKDTTFVLMLQAHRQGHQVFYLSNQGIVAKKGKVYFNVTAVTPQRMAKKTFIEHNKLVLSQEDVHCVFIRTDPPFDQQYLINTWLLDLLPKNIPVINSPCGVRTVNEKIWATQFTSLVPRTLISSSKKELLGFLNKEKNIVIKPTDGHGGKGVFHLRAGDSNINVVLETMTAAEKQPLIAQQFIPASVEGDKRILLLNGEPLGAVLRVHAKDDHRNNIFAGGKVKAAKITQRDLEIINVLKPELQRLGLYFVGIDIIGDYLIEVNVTSPTCLQEMNRLYKLRLETKVIDFVENLIDHA